MKTRLHALDETVRSRQGGDQAQGNFGGAGDRSSFRAGIEWIRTTMLRRVHRKFLGCWRRSAIRLRARKSRERTLDSVMLRTAAISTLESSSKEESIRDRKSTRLNS